MEIRPIDSQDTRELGDLFRNIDTTHFRPHPMNEESAAEIVSHRGADVYLIGFDGPLAVAYGMLRGWEEGYPTPSLGVAVRSGHEGVGFGRSMVLALHERARERGTHRVRLRVALENTRARHLYESIGYQEAGMERGEMLMYFDLT